MSVEFYWIAVAVVTVVSASRLTRLGTVDKFPPAKWLRTKYENLTDGSDWQWLTMCGYCFAAWPTLAVMLWGWFAGVYSPPVAFSGWVFAWWIFNGWLAAAYAAAVFMAYDGAEGEN